MERRLGNYTIQGEIGRGGMATVYRAVQESLHRVVALKELDLARLRSEPRALERFHLEARAAASLDHPNIVTVYDLWEEEDKAYIAMEFIDGVELKDVLFNLGSIDHLNAVLIALAVSEALHYAHSRNMVHRDVKPGNIMLTAAGEIRLMDFGIVSVSGGGDLTVSGQILGTPAYMAPEQIAGERAGPPADLFSLGAVLYEMIAGRKPFTGPNHIALIQDVLHGQPTPLHEVMPEVAESISHAVIKCLEKDPGNRYGSVEEFTAVMEMVLPLDRPDRKTAVKGLVKDTREQERTKLHTSAGDNDRTSPQVTATVPSGDGAEPAAALPARGHAGGAIRAQSDSLIREPGACIHDLEEAPPAELPPLEGDDSLTGGYEGESLPEEKPEKPLSFKEIPERPPDGLTEGYDVLGHDRAKGRGKSVKTVLWVLPVLLLAGAALYWTFNTGSKPEEFIKRIIPAQPAAKASVTVLAEPAGRVFMDGALIGTARPSLTFEAEAGLHSLIVRHPEYGPKKMIVELEPGQEKEIKVKFEP